MGSTTNHAIPRDRVFILTGLPRQGTTYLAAVPHASPAVVCQSEARGAWKRAWRDLGFREFVTVRHPAAIINSWLSRPAQRLAGGRRLEGNFGNGDTATFTATATDPLDRCIGLHEHLAQRIVGHLDDPGVLVVRYADWFSDPDALERIQRFLGLETTGPPTPTPMRRKPPTFLPHDGLERVRVGCESAAALGFDRGLSGWVESVL